MDGHKLITLRAVKGFSNFMQTKTIIITAIFKLEYFIKWKTLKTWFTFPCNICIPLMFPGYTLFPIHIPTTGFHAASPRKQNWRCHSKTNQCFRCLLFTWVSSTTFTEKFTKLSLPNVELTLTNTTLWVWTRNVHPVVLSAETPAR